MPFVYNSLRNEYSGLQEKKQDYLLELQELPRGALLKKRIKGREYDYLVYRESGKVVTTYVKQDRVPQVRAQLERRKEIEKVLSGITVDMKLIEKVVKPDSFTSTRKPVVLEDAISTTKARFNQIRPTARPQKNQRGARPRNEAEKAALIRAVISSVKKAEATGYVVKTARGYTMSWKNQ